MKKILYVITKSNFGGAQRYVYELATGISQADFEAHVALGGDGVLIDMLEQAKIPVHRLTDAQRDINLLKEVKLLWRLITIMLQVRPDIVHLNSPKIGGLGAVAARLCGVKHVIYTNHGWPFNEERPEWQKFIIKFLSWLTVFLCSKTVVLSKLERDMVPAWLQLSHKLVLIPNAQAAFEPMNKLAALTALIGQEKAEHIFNEHIQVLGTIAELHKNKGLTYAIEGFAECKDERMVFIIIGEGEERAMLEAQIKELNLEQKVFLVGKVENARAYLSAFDYFILSSVKEGLPYAILEAGYVGLPVIATNVGGIPELVTNLQEGLIISPRRPREIKQALIYIREHEAEVHQFALALQQKVKTAYSFDLMKTRMERLYIHEDVIDHIGE